MRRSCCGFASHPLRCLAQSILLLVVAVLSAGPRQGEAAARSITISPDSLGAQVPTSFLGLSHEPITMAKHVVLTPQYQAFIKLLSSFDTGPLILRWGGNEQDKITEVLDDAQWRSMRDLSAKTGVRHMIGLNLRARDPQLALTQVTNAMRFLKPESVLAFNIGNEPDAFTFRDNKTIFPADYWKSGWFRDVANYSDTLAPVLKQYFGTTKMISGPGSADMTQWRDAQANKFGGVPPLSQYSNMLTAHYYTYRSTSPGASYQTFLAESKLELVQRRVGPWMRWARKYNLQFRLEETNTLAIQGLAGASDTLAAALFYIDYALTMIKAGVSGMNFHDSWCSAYSPIVFPSLCLPAFATRGSCADTCGQPGLPPTIRAPYYGMLFVQKAISGLPKVVTGVVVQRAPGPNIKVHVLSSGSELRIILVKKDGANAEDVDIVVHGNYGPGTLSLLVGPAFDAFIDDITLAGQQVNARGQLTGDESSEAVEVEYLANDSKYTVKLQAASAGLLILRPMSE